jgi:anti-sigma B factor antagonist
VRTAHDDDQPQRPRNPQYLDDFRSVTAFEVDTELDGRRMTLSLRGELDLGTAPILEQAIDALPWQELDELVIDLHEIKFIDSSGLSILIRASQRAASGSRRFSITRVPEQPRKLFDFAGVTDTLGIGP